MSGGSSNAEKSINPNLESLIDGLVGKYKFLFQFMEFNCVLGGTSAAIANAFLNPLHVIRVRLSTQQSKD